MIGKCKKCGYQAGVFGLKDGVCKKCLEAGEEAKYENVTVTQEISIHDLIDESNVGGHNRGDKEMSDAISVEEMNSEKLYALFNAAYMKPEYDSDGDVRLTGPSGFHQILSLDMDKKLIKYMSMYGFKEGRGRGEKLEFINKLNNTVVFCRYSMPSDNALISDYFLSYEDGITPLQVISSMRWFDKVAAGAIRAYDETDLVA